MVYFKCILVLIDDKEYCMRVFDCKYIMVVEYFVVVFNSVSILCVFLKFEFF